MSEIGYETVENVDLPGRISTYRSTYPPLQPNGDTYEPNPNQLQKVERNCLTPEEIEWIRYRDWGRCQDPLIDEDGWFMGYVECTNPYITTVHHITPSGLYLRAGSQDYEARLQHSATNLITLNWWTHKQIHEENWRRSECAEYGNAFTWFDQKDIYYRIIATINSYLALRDMLGMPEEERVEFPFGESEVEIILDDFELILDINHGSILQNFVESYLAFKQRQQTGDLS